MALATVTRADAYWTASGAGIGNGSAGTLDEPEVLSTTPGTGTVALSWSSITPPDPGAVSYYVTRDAGDPAGDCPTAAAPQAVFNCTDDGLDPGAHVYTVVAVWRSWTATSPDAPVNVLVGALHHFTLSTPPSARAAGTPFTISITARDSLNQTITAYTGAHCIEFSGPLPSPNGTAPLYPAQGGCAAGQSSITFTNGVAGTVPITLYRATPSELYPGTQTTITATDSPSGKNGSTNPFNVNGTGALVRFVVIPATTTPVAGQGNNLTIVAGDAYGNPVLPAAFANGLHNLYFSGATQSPSGSQPRVTRNTGAAINFGNQTRITFTNGVSRVTGTSNGVMTLYRVEGAAIRVAEGSVTGNYRSNPVTVNVQPAALTTFTVANPATQTAGNQFNVSITATDPYGNGNFGTRCLTFSGPLNGPDGTPPSYPAQGSCATGQNEINFTAAPTLVPVTLFRAASTTLTITDVASGSARTTAPFTVNPAAIDSFSMTAATTTPTAGAANNLTITAFDPFGNLATGYTGSHNLTFSGSRAIGIYEPTVTNSGGAQIDFGATTAINFTTGVSTVGGGSNGVMRLYRAGTARIVVSDGAHTNGSGLEITVAPATMSNLSLSAEKAVVRPGAPNQTTLRAVDQYGNSAPGYSDGAHDLTFGGGSGSRTVTNSSGAQINFGNPVSLIFGNGITTAGGEMRIGSAQTANITATDGTHTTSPLRIVVSSVSASAVSAGGFHTCALVAGAVQCWGRGDSGQLGNGGFASSSSPVAVGGLTNVTQVVAGKFHTCALRSDGTVWCWGLNDYGQLGNDDTGNNSSTPVQVVGVGGVGYLTGATEIDADGKFSCALISDGSVRCWGRNQSGQLGNGTTNNSDRPVVVEGVGGVGTLTGASSITVGANHACALVGGGVDCWGLNDHGQLGNDDLGDDSSSPVRVLGPGGAGFLSGVTEISGGRMHVCVLRDDSTVYCWGRNETGELGDGTTTNRAVPVRAGEISTATQVSAGEYHSCARLADGTAQCWGAAAFGQIGDGTTSDTSVPVTVVGPGGYGVLTGVGEISAGGGDVDETNDWEHSCALTNDYTVVCWGQNNFGQLGDGTTTMSIMPAGVALL